MALAHQDRRLNEGMEELGRSEALALVSGQRIGRLAFVDGAGRVEIFPVNFVLDDDGILVRTDVGAKLNNAAGPGAPVAFEVDHLDADSQSGWSVVLHGWARLAGAATATKIGPGWVPVDKPHVIRIAISEVTGRRIGGSMRPGGRDVRP